MNEVNILLADNEKFKFVSAVFAPYTGSKTYTYKTLLDVEEEDFVVVQTPSNGFQVVQVREVLTPFEVNLEAGIEYKWVIQKIDVAHFEQVVSMEKEIRAIVKIKSKNKRAINEARQAILEHTDSEIVTRLVLL